MATLTAVILAAGRGTRLASTLANKPKGFLPFKETTFIERALDLLEGAGVSHTVIVTGYGAKSYEGLALRRGSFVSTVHNPDFIEKGTMQSLLVALGVVSGDILVLDADIIYEACAISALVQSPHENAVLLSDVSGIGDENYAWVFDELPDGACLRLISKNINALPTAAHSEHVGIMKIGTELAKALRQSGPSTIEDTPLCSYEQCLTPLLETYPVYTVCIAKLIWAEVDNMAMWARVQENIIPQL